MIVLWEQHYSYYNIYMTMPVPLAASDESEGAMLCRICLGTDEPELMIAPCSCRGSSKWVHRFCLDEWRAQERVQLAFSHCSVCRFAYELEAETSFAEQGRRNVRFGLLVSRDIFLFFLCVQSTIAGLGFIIHAIDRAVNCPTEKAWSIPCNTTAITRLYPHEWANDNSVSHLRLGPYYVTAFLLLLVLLGIVGSGLWCLGKMPRAPAPGTSASWRQAVRTGESAASSGGHAAPGIRRRSGRHDRCDCGYCDCDDVCLYCYITDGGSSSGECCAGCARACCECERCSCPGGGGAAGECGEAGGVMLVIGAALLVVFALIGVIVGIFFSTIIFQRIVQSHFHLLAMRAEASRFRVKDLAQHHVDVEQAAAARAGTASVAPQGQTIARSL
jgi:hypothetical protein